MQSSSTKLNPLDGALKGMTIPSCPAILARLMDELCQPRVSTKRIAALIGEDVGLAAAVIKSANSPLLGVRRQIASLDEAMGLLGFGMVANLVQETLLQRAMSGAGTSLERFWDNSRCTAAASAQVARATRTLKPETAYTFGLFHDCGIPLMVQRFEGYKQVLGEANQTTDRWFTTIEDEALGTNHAVVGYFLARSWGLSDAVCQGILCHHDYSVLEAESDLDNETRMLIAVNAVATYIAGTHLRSGSDAEWDKARLPAAHFLGYAPDDLDNLAEDLVYKLDQQTRSEAA